MVKDKEKRQVRLPDLNGDCLLRLNQILQIVPISKSKWWQLVHDGFLERPIKLGVRCSCWRGDYIKRILAGEVLNLGGGGADE